MKYLILLLILASCGKTYKSALQTFHTPNVVLQVNIPKIEKFTLSKDMFRALCKSDETYKFAYWNYKNRFYDAIAFTQDGIRKIRIRKTYKQNESYASTVVVWKKGISPTKIEITVDKKHENGFQTVYKKTSTKITDFLTVKELI